jgi:hypothetical protein
MDPAIGEVVGRSLRTRAVPSDRDRNELGAEVDRVAAIQSSAESKISLRRCVARVERWRVVVEVSLLLRARSHEHVSERAPRWLIRRWHLAIQVIAVHVLNPHRERL